MKNVLTCATIMFALLFTSCDKQEPIDQDVSFEKAQFQTIEDLEATPEFKAVKKHPDAYEKDGVFYSSYAQYQKLTQNGQRSASHYIRLTTQGGQSAPQADMYSVQVKSGGSYQHISWLQTTSMTIALPWAGANLCGGMVQFRNATFGYGDDCGTLLMEYWVGYNPGTKYHSQWTNGYGDFSGNWDYNYYKAKNGVISGIQILTGNCDGSWEEC